MDLDRRNILLGLAGAASLAGAAACSRAQDVDPETAPAIDNQSDFSDALVLPALPDAPLLNRARASQIMAAQGVDALICARPENIYYLTNHYPMLAKMGIPQLSYAIVTRDETIAPLLVIGQFAYYLGATERATPKFVDVRLYTAPAEADSYFQSFSVFEQMDAAAIESFLPQMHDAHPLHPIEQKRRDLTLEVSERIYPTSEVALLKATKDLLLTDKRVAVDNGTLKGLLERADRMDIAASGEDLIRQIRLQKTSAEIELARYAARANAEAGLTAAKSVRDGASFQDLRTQYALACAERSLTTKFMVIDGIIPDSVPRQIEDGRSFLIDCVSHHQYYHGDYGRTVCVGEPTRHIQKATAALSKVWDELLPQLKPGVRYSEISAMATKAYADQTSEATLICNPHSVGVHHTDEPSRPNTYHWAKDDLELLEGMVLSVDLPIADIGLGGSGHLEDLVLIGAEGAELLNDTGDRVIIV
ncbi:MAG: M24 family metallopeptidase [Pseudomonadota bacterium]